MDDNKAKEIIQSFNEHLNKFNDIDSTFTRIRMPNSAQLLLLHSQTWREICRAGANFMALLESALKWLDFATMYVGKTNDPRVNNAISIMLQRITTSAHNVERAQDEYRGHVNFLIAISAWVISMLGLIVSLIGSERILRWIKCGIDIFH